MKVKSNSITLELKKAKSKYWDDIKEKKGSALGGVAPAKSKRGEEEKDNEDPSASLMSMMKDLYDKGDDQMKRTIAESWEKAQKDKAAGGKI